MGNDRGDDELVSITDDLQDEQVRELRKPE
jgi:hypothetical protein